MAEAGEVLVERSMTVDHPAVSNQELGVRLPEDLRHRPTFVVIEPDGALATGAAVAAASAFEAEAVVEPPRFITVVVFAHASDSSFVSHRACSRAISTESSAGRAPVGNRIPTRR